MNKVLLATLAFALLFAVIDAQYPGAEGKDANEDALKLIHQQVHLDKDQRREMRRKYLKKETNIDDLMAEIESLKGKYPIELDAKRKEQLKYIKEKLEKRGRYSQEARDGL